MAEVIGNRFLCFLGYVQAFVLSALLVAPAQAQTSSEGSLPISGAMSTDGTELELSWKNAMTMRVLNSEVYRREFGAKGPQSWQLIEPKLGRSFIFRDTGLQPGTAYEYKVVRYDTEIVDVGYWLAGVDVPAAEFRGRAFVVIDETLAEPLAPVLERFSQDLTGDGWAVMRHDVPRGVPGDPVANLANAREIRHWIADQYQRDVYREFVLILVGHVPVVYSGRVAPDGHAAKPHPTDLFYADVNGIWKDASDGALQPDIVPSNFIEFPVGRIDFSGMSGGALDTELALLRAYFDKNHHWRHGMIGDLREAYGATDYLRVERDQLRNIVGAEAITVGGHHDVGEERPWLFGVDFGDWEGGNYADYANKAVFSINFGSGKQYFANGDNPMRGMLVQPWYGLASAWGARPSWRLHPMSLGGTIGLAQLKTVNNGRYGGDYRVAMDYFPTGQYLLRNPIWVNLMGDPTLRAFPTRPPREVQVDIGASGAEVSWSVSQDVDVVGYRIYRAQDGGARFETVSDPLSADTVSFFDPDGMVGDRYMVRALSRKTVPAGSFFSLSQGAFAQTETAPAPDAMITQTLRGGQAVTLELVDDPDAGILRAFVEGTEAGDLARGTDGLWVFTPKADAVGEVALRFSEWDGVATRERIFALTVEP
ncbi:MAG: fibronectin type III domain-containing protein [Pseudomonadota bacterium]